MKKALTKHHKMLSTAGLDRLRAPSRCFDECLSSPSLQGMLDEVVRKHGSKIHDLHRLSQEDILSSAFQGVTRAISAGRVLGDQDLKSSLNEASVPVRYASMSVAQALVETVLRKQEPDSSMLSEDLSLTDEDLLPIGSALISALLSQSRGVKPSVSSGPRKEFWKPLFPFSADRLFPRTDVARPEHASFPERPVSPVEYRQSDSQKTESARIGLSSTGLEWLEEAMLTDRRRIHQFASSSRPLSDPPASWHTGSPFATLTSPVVRRPTAVSNVRSSHEDGQVEAIYTSMQSACTDQIVEARHVSAPDGLSAKAISRSRNTRPSSRIPAGISNALDSLSNVAFRVNTRTLAAVQWADEHVSCLETRKHLHLPLPVSFPMEPESEKAKFVSRELFSDRIRIMSEFSASDSGSPGRMYFPHSLDFRGRAYPICGTLNHQQEDLVRGALDFFDGSRVSDSKQVVWLHRQIAGLVGLDKKPHAEREKWFLSNESLVLHLANAHHSVSVPMAAQMSENPWQLLQSAWEYSSLVEYSRKHGSPVGFLSRVPIHQDGTCNGMQHYAALGRDIEAARATNLLPASDGTVRDVYTDVLETMKLRIKAEADSILASNGSESDSHPAVVALNHPELLVRKIVKQTVMTICYGVTPIGAIAQIRKAIEASISDSEKFLKRGKDSIPVYLAGVLFKSVSDVFTHGMEIRDWLADSCRLVVGSGLPMKWLSPSGLAVVQPYVKVQGRNVPMIRTPLGSFRAPIGVGNRDVDKQKQALAFPPNFIHSLDASHMLFVANACASAGVGLATVHDCFWTSLAHVDKMNLEIRAQFIRLHEMMPLERLKMSLELSLPGHSLPALPARGALDLALVRDSEYFFS